MSIVSVVGDFRKREEVAEVAFSPLSKAVEAVGKRQVKARMAPQPLQRVAKGVEHAKSLAVRRTCCSQLAVEAR